MAGGECRKLPKPRMSGMSWRSTQRNITVALTLSVLSGLAYRLLVCDPRKRRYRNFYENYDHEKEFERMRAKGLFQSC